MAAQMTEVEKEILSDPFLSETVEVNFAARSEAFQDAYREKIRHRQTRTAPVRCCVGYTASIRTRIRNLHG